MTSLSFPSCLPTRFLDRTRVMASIGCAFHCLTAPALLLAAPALGGWWVHPLTHLLIAAVVVPVAGLALWRGYGWHRRRWIVAAGALGIALVVAGALLPWLLPADAPAPQTAAATCHACCPSVVVDATSGAWSLRVPPASIVTMLGGIFLVVAHAANLRHRCCRRDGHTRPVPGRTAAVMGAPARR